MVINSTGVQQIYYRNDGELMELCKNFVVIENGFLGVTGLEPVTDLSEKVNSAQLIVFHRTFGLGDILMLLPVIREFKTRYPGKEYILATTDVHNRWDIVRALAPDVFDGFIEPTNVWRLKYDLGFYLDWYLEMDHTEPSMYGSHRVDSYRKFFGLETGKKPVWSDLEKPTDSGYVLLHEGGNWAAKAFLRPTFEYLFDELGKKYDIIGLPINEKLEAEELISLVLEASCIITFDTAPLWISHFTKTPLIALLGPTPDNERLPYHPCYPGKVRGIRLEKEVGCKPCREKLDTCQNKIDCMKVGKERVLELIDTALEEIL